MLPPFVCLFWAVTIGCGRKPASRLRNLSILVFLALAALSFGWIYVSGYTFADRMPVGLSVTMLVLSSLFYIVGYRIFRLGDKKESPQVETLPAPEEEPLSHHARLLPEFTRLMDEEKLYLQPGLRIEDIAHLLNTNRTYVSRLLHKEYNCGFFEYVNHRRITYAQERLRLNPDLTQERLATESGFIHASSFSRAFKQHTGITFREWQKSMR